MRILPAILALPALLLAQPVRAQTSGPLVLAPSSPWYVNYADESCELVRQFGEGDQQVTLGFRAYEPSGLFWISVGGGPTTASTFRTNTVRLSFTPVEELDVSYLRSRSASGPGLAVTVPIFIGPLSPEAREQFESGLAVRSFADPEVEASVEQIGFSQGFATDFVMQTGSMRAPMASLRECARELTTHWPINVDHHEAVTHVATPTSSARGWLHRGHYPANRRFSGILIYRLIVDEEGGVAGCHVFESARQRPTVSRIACERLTLAARFHPALDSNGQPTRDYYVGWAFLGGGF